MKILTFVVTGPGHRHRRALNFPFSYLLLLAAASFRFFSIEQYWATLEILTFSLWFSPSSLSPCHLSSPVLHKLPTPPLFQSSRPPSLWPLLLKLYWNDSDSVILFRFRVSLVRATSNEIYPNLYLTSHFLLNVENNFVVALVSHF